MNIYHYLNSGKDICFSKREGEGQGSGKLDGTVQLLHFNLSNVLY